MMRKPYFRDETEAKKAFALELCYSQLNRMAAARRAFGEGPEAAAQVAYAAHYWPHDPEVRQEVRRLYDEHGADHFQASADMFSGIVFEWSTSPGLDAEVRVKAMKLYAELRGHIKKPDAAAPVNIITPGVLLIPDSGSEDEWERRTAEHQRTLIGHAS